MSKTALQGSGSRISGCLLLEQSPVGVIDFALMPTDSFAADDERSPESGVHGSHIPVRISQL
jgi:hypothetical protein